MANRYHVNSDTGNANLCRAKIKCRFGGAELHFDTPQAARTHYEESLATSGFKSVASIKLSRGAKVLRALDLAQRELSLYHNAKSDSDETGAMWRAGFTERLAARDRCAEALRSLPWDFSDAPTFDDAETIDFLSSPPVDDAPRYGYTNDFLTKSQAEIALYDQLDEAGVRWIGRLSTGEIRAVAEYAVGATNYARTMAGEEGLMAQEAVAGLHSAMAKAPRLAEPIRVYSGISEARSADIERQAEEGAIELNRVQSASANPAQVNGFMFSFPKDGSPPKEIAVEFTVARAASLSAFNVHRGEMELLVPPGSYKVIERYEGVSYYWGGENRQGRPPIGREAAITYVVEPE